MNRRSFLKKGLTSLFVLLGIGSGGYLYAREIEPSLIEIRKEKIFSDKIARQFDNYTIIQFSDTHVGFHYSIDQLHELILLINAQEPDMIVFTGDLVDNPNKFHDYGRLQEALSMLTAKDGKYWIYGNHDHGGYGTEIIRQCMDNSGFVLLQNSHTVIQREREKLILAGIDDGMLGKPDFEHTLRSVSENDFTILLAHEPDLADKAVHYPVDVQLSGHSHGGQIRLPFIGHVYTPLMAEKYVRGKFVLNPNFTLFVNSGIGTTRLPYRLFCQPEIHVYQLKSSR